MYSGHKRIHGFKYQSLDCPNGLIANLFGPIESSHHDSYVLLQSRLVARMQARGLRDRDGRPFAIYGDPAYPLRDVLMVGYKGGQFFHRHSAK